MSASCKEPFDSILKIASLMRSFAAMVVAIERWDSDKSNKKHETE